MSSNLGFATAVLFGAIHAPPAAAAQLGLGLTGQELAQRDLQSSPLVYQGLGGGLWLQGRQQVGRWRLEQALSLGLGGMHIQGMGPRSFSMLSEDPVTGEQDVNAFQEPNSAQWGSLGVEGRRGLGGGAVEAGLRMEADALNSNSVALGHWAWFVLDLGPTVAWSTRLSPDAGLHLDLSLPVAAVVTRFPDDLNPLLSDRSQVAGFFATGTRVASVGSHQRLALGAELELEGEGRWSWVLGLRTDWLHDAAPENLYRLRGMLTLGGRLGSRRSP